MVLHLEAGTCPSGCDTDRVDEVAFACYQSRHYVADEDSDFDYCCRICDAEFHYMSGLLQHAESDAWLSLGLAFYLNFLPLTLQLSQLSGSLWSKALQVNCTNEVI